MGVRATRVAFDAGINPFLKDASFSSAWNGMTSRLYNNLLLGIFIKKLIKVSVLLFIISAMIPCRGTK